MVELSPAKRKTEVRFCATTDVLESFYTMLMPCGLVVRIWRSHRHGPGSIPGMGILRAKFFDERTAESSQKPLNLRFKFLSLINSGLPHIITMTIIWFFFFILTIV